MAVTILLEPCINCGLCRKACPTETIHFFTTGKRTHVVDPAGCIDCDICIPVCPEKCIVRDEEYVHDADVLSAAKVRARDWAKKQNGLRQRVKDRAAAAIAAVN